MNSRLQGCCTESACVTASVSHCFSLSSKLLLNCHMPLVADVTERADLQWAMRVLDNEADGIEED